MKRKRLLQEMVIFCSLLITAALAHAQNKIIAGKVTDSKDGSAVQGVSVTPAGASQGTVTGVDGLFRISVSPQTTQLIFTSVGYATQRLDVSAGQMNVVLTSTNATLNDVVVIGYGTQRQKDLTGSIATVNSRDFQQGSAIVSPDQLIAGKLAGVSVTSNGGQPGAATTVRIRGLSSLNGNNDPLYVIDGVPLQSLKTPPPNSTSTISGVSDPLATINTNDIESITVLKDASAAAIYGSRASAGVILITTKKGKSGSPTFNFNTQLGIATIAKEENVLSADQFRTYVNANGSAAQKALLGGSNTNWQNEIYQTGLTTNSNLNISGTLHHLPYYYASIGYLDQQGILKTDNLQRTSATLKLNPHFLEDHLRIDINLNGSNTQSRFANQQAIGSAIAFDPTQPIYRKGSPFGGYFEWTSAGADSTPNSNATRNPVALLNQYKSTSMANRLYGNVQIDYKLHFLPDLHANLNIGFDESKGQGNVNIPGNAAQQWSTTTNHGQNYQYLGKNNNTVLEFKLNYLKDLPSIQSSINLLAGYGYYNNLQTNNNYASFDSKGDTIPGTAPLYKNIIQENTLLSYFGRLIYTLDSKYILTASLRTDGSSRVAPASRWGTFPAIAVAWRIKQEDFLKNINILSDLKLRGSYGVTGNLDGISNYSYYPSYSLSQNGSQYQFGNNFYYLYTPAPYVRNLRWEQTASTNIGLDYGFLNNRITGSIEYYHKNTTNLLNYVFIPDGTNFTNAATINVGSMVSKGFEFTINTSPVRTKDFSWDVSFNFTYENIKITKLTNNSKDSTFYGDATGGIAGGTGQSIQIQTVGYSPNSFFVLQQIYSQKTGLPIEGLYVDRNRDGIISQPNDQYHYKSPFAPVIMGFSTGFHYKQWALNMVLRANVGNYMYNNVAANLDVQRSILNPIGTLDNVLTGYTKTNFNNNQYQSDIYIENASFIKMDNLNINYQVGKVFHGKARLTVSAYCQNVFTITKYSGLDPEVYGGIDNNIYPKPRTYTLGLNLGF